MLINGPFVFFAVCGGVICILVITYILIGVVCVLYQKKKKRNENFQLPNAQPPSTQILPPPRPGFTTDPQPEHTGSSFAYTPLPDSDKPPSAYDLHDNLPTHNTQRTSEGSNLSPPHQPSYGACTPTTSNTAAATVAPPPHSSGVYTGTGTSAVSPL